MYKNAAMLPSFFQATLSALCPPCAVVLIQRTKPLLPIIFAMKRTLFTLAPAGQSNDWCCQNIPSIDKKSK